MTKLMGLVELGLIAGSLIHLKSHPYTEKKTWYCGQASCSLFTNFFGKKVTTNFSLSKLQTKFIDYRLNR